MKKIILSSILLSSMLLAGGDKEPVTTEVIPIVEDVPNWLFEFSPYLAMSSISGDSGVITPSAPLDLDFDTILDALEFGASGHFEAHNKSGWGVWLDYNYVSLGASGDTGLLNLDVKQAVFEGYAIYRQELSTGTLDYLMGIRNWHLKMDAKVYNQANIHNTDESWVDAVMGARWTSNLSENWKFYLKGDIGAGDSALTASAVLGFRYDINDWIDFDIQYKGLWVDYETGTPNSIDYFKYDTVTYGPIVGLNFKF
jgi:hypothetical protein